jgi:MFS family permease
MAAAVEQSQASAEAPWPSPRMAWTTLALLMLGVFASCLDRTVIPLLVEPIKAHYRLSDTQFGALQGLAFGTFYVTMAIPLGMLADRYQRRVVIAAGIALFNLFSILTGLARSYGQLFVARMGVGFGEASLQPSAFSLISDNFPPAKLGRAISLFIMCNYVGSSMALAVGGALVGAFDRIEARQPGVLHGLAPWQATIICIAVPGILLFPLFLLIREPRRRGVAKTPVGWSEIFREIWRRRRVFGLIFGACAMANALTTGVATWIPALFIRTHDWSPAVIGLWLGVLLLAGGTLGSFAGGWMTDRLTARGELDAPLKVAAWGFCILAPFSIAAPLMPRPELALLFYVPQYFVLPAAFSVVPAALQLITANQLRAQVGAAYLTFINLIGTFVGPLLVGVMSDYAAGDAQGLRWAMALVAGITTPLMIVLMMLARRPYRVAREGGL